MHAALLHTTSAVSLHATSSVLGVRNKGLGLANSGPQPTGRAERSTYGGTVVELPGPHACEGFAGTDACSLAGIQWSASWWIEVQPAKSELHHWPLESPQRDS